MLLVDSHCHIHKGKSGTGALTGGRGEKDSWKTQPTLFEGDTTCVVASNAEKLDCGDVILYCSMAVEEGDWAMLISMEEQGQQHKAVAAGGLGIHPWKAHEAKPGWESRLREALIRRPSLLVGEIGLDKSREADKTGWEIQLKMFEEQMELAAELRRPVSIHCVRAYGTVYDWLKKRPMATECPPSLAFHSYTGSPEMAAAFLALPHLKGSVFFGFSLSVCLRSPATETRLYNVLSVLPRESLLLESDLDDRCAVRVAMMRMCEVVARATGVQRQSLAEITTRNAERFLRTKSLNMTAHHNVTSSSLHLFETAWRAYRKLVDEDYMEHAALTAVIAAVLPTLLPPAGSSTGWMADLGCGDLGLLAPLLRPLPLAGFIGVDATAEVLPLAAGRLGGGRGEGVERGYGGAPWPCEWVCADLLDWSEERRKALQEEGVIDASGVEPNSSSSSSGSTKICSSPLPRMHVISCLFALHHLSDPLKQRALAALRACMATGGSLLIADVFRKDGEDREAYLSRYKARTVEWVRLEKEEREAVLEHVCTSDYPSERSEFVALARRAGWGKARWLWGGMHEAEAVLLLQF